MARIEQKQVVYKIVGEDKLTLDIFAPANHNTDKPLPVIVFFFGWGWVAGSPDQFYPQCRYFASRGMVAISADYRTKTKYGTTPFECVRDGKSAIRYIRANAAELGIDPEKIVAAGGSAGGHIAVCTAVIDGYNEEGEDPAVSFVPNALVLFNPVVDTTEKGYGADLLKGRETEISPVHHIKKGVAPCIIFHGTSDKDIPLENVERFCGLMKQAGNICELVRFEQKEHGFYNYGLEENKIFLQTLGAAEKFLSSHGFLR